MAFGTPVKYTSAGLLSSGVVRATALVMQLAEGFNPTAGALYIAYFALPAVPGNGAIPAFVQLVPAGGSFAWAPGGFGSGGFEGRDFPFGMSWGVSSTAATYTAAADTIWMDVTGRATA